jgi:hypothetical protein
VITDDLVECAGATRVRTRCPVGESFVQLRPLLLRDTRVGRVANQRVAEAVGILAPRAGGQEILAHETEQARVQFRPLLLGRQLDDRAAGKFLSRHGGALE